MQAPVNHGKYDEFPVLPNFGDQHQIQYVKVLHISDIGKFPAMGSGLEKSLFLPSMVHLNGFRFGKGNWEVVIGPFVSLHKEATGFYNTNGYLKVMTILTPQ
jgi:hypothetical protein